MNANEIKLVNRVVRARGRQLIHCFHLCRSVFICGFLLLCGVSVARGENWPGWRGPRGDGTSVETGVPVEWSAKDGSRRNVAWTVDIPGKGHASPIVWDSRVFVVTCDEERQERLLLCLNRDTGETLWRRTVLRSPLEKKHILNSFASSTPATDGERVYVTFLKTDGSEGTNPRATPGAMVVVAYDLDGHELWRKEPGPFSSMHGYCSSPVLFEGIVIVNGDHDGDGYLVALDKQTGDTVWKTPRENNTRSYCTPIIREIDGRTQMILSGDKCVASYDPHNGSRHWVLDGPTEQFVASLVYNGRHLFLTAGYPDKHMLAIDPRGSGNITKTHIAWRTREACSYVPSPIAAGDYFLITSDEGIASCFEADSGKRLWRQRLGTHYSGSPVLVDGLVYFTADNGVTKVVRPGTKLEVIAENHLGEDCYASPAVSQGRIFIRGEMNLYCISFADAK
jgi:outer membrane protein assembly factor BamB